jgi:hypothetical protein
VSFVLISRANLVIEAAKCGLCHIPSETLLSFDPWCFSEKIPAISLIPDLYRLGKLGLRRRVRLLPGTLPGSRLRRYGSTMHEFRFRVEVWYPDGSVSLLCTTDSENCAQDIYSAMVTKFRDETVVLWDGGRLVGCSVTVERY